MTDEVFARFCAEHPDLDFEMTAEGELIVLPPPYSVTGIRQGKIFAQLNAWAEIDGRGVAGEATTSFVLPNGARRSPDASWILKSEIQKLSPESRDGFSGISVLHLLSNSARRQTGPLFFASKWTNTSAVALNSLGSWIPKPALLRSTAPSARSRS
jgi:hypothetical protein